MLRVAMSNDPLSSTRSFEVQLALQVLGRRDEAEAEYQRCLDLPGADAREDIHHWALFRVWDGGDAALVEQRFDNYLRRQTVQSKWVRSVRAVYQDRDAALAVLCAALGDTANQDATRLSFLAGYAGHLGDAELALTAARRSLIDLRNQAANFLWWPEMANVRRLPGFKDLVREMGMVDYWRTTGRWGDFCRPVGDDDFEFFWPAQYIAFLNGTAH
jgi:tetratricopeptide (TPR) repeat protein